MHDFNKLEWMSELRDSVSMPPNQETADHVRSIADSHLYEVTELIIYGSRARGNHDNESDVDIIIVSPDFRGKEYYSRATDFHFSWDTGRFPIPDLICLNPEEFKQRRESEGDIVNVAVDEGIRF